MSEGEYTSKKCECQAHFFLILIFLCVKKVSFGAGLVVFGGGNAKFCAVVAMRSLVK